MQIFIFSQLKLFQIFTQSVSEKDVPGYRSIIKKPMDFQKMQSRLDRGEYKRIADLRGDFNLVNFILKNFLFLILFRLWIIVQPSIGTIHSFGIMAIVFDALG